MELQEENFLEAAGGQWACRKRRDHVEGLVTTRKTGPNIQ